MKKLTAPILLVGAAVESADLRYASGFAAVDPVVHLRDGKKNFLIVPMMELGRARREAKQGVCVLTPAELCLKKTERRRISSWMLALLHDRRIRRVVVPPSFPIGIALRLRRAGIRLVVAKRAAFPEREVKSEREVACIRESQTAAAAAMRFAIQTISKARVNRAGFLVDRGHRLTAEEVRRAIDLKLTELNCVARDTIVACGKISADPHARGEGPMRAGEPIVIDIFPQHKVHGYWGDITRTIVKGKASAELRRMYNAVKAAQKAALGTVKAGARAKRIHGAVHRLFVARGFRTEIKNGHAEGFTHSTGHGVGLEIHESPSLSPGPGRLKAGNVVTVEPGLYYRKLGGVRIEDTVLVTRTGFKHLAKVPRRLEV
jgi:Xaa-Pro aminopeptidase